MNKQLSSDRRLSPIFLFSNWRTSGTALAFAFRKSPQFYVYTEPFNPTLRDPELALRANTSGWRSKHPSNQFYFTEYAPLLKSSDFFFPEVEKLPYVLGPNDRCDDLHRYLSQLIDFAQSQGKAPVFKFEQLEGSAPWIAANFSDGLRIGVTRDPRHQLISWMEQASFGIDNFFILAHRLIENNLEYFMTDHIEVRNRGDVEAFTKIFDVFRRRIDMQHSNHMHFCLDLSPETTEVIETQLEKIAIHDGARLAEWKLVLHEVRSSLQRESDASATLRRLSALVSVKHECETLRVVVDEAQAIRMRIRELDERENLLQKLQLDEQGVLNRKLQLDRKEILLREIQNDLEKQREALDAIIGSKRWKVLMRIWGLFERIKPRMRV